MRKNSAFTEFYKGLIFSQGPIKMLKNKGFAVVISDYLLQLCPH